VPLVEQAILAVTEDEHRAVCDAVYALALGLEMPDPPLRFIFMSGTEPDYAPPEGDHAVVVTCARVLLKKRDTGGFITPAMVETLKLVGKWSPA